MPSIPDSMHQLIYIANYRLPTEKAHGLQVMKMCEAFSDLGFVVELWLPKRRNHLAKDEPFVFYNVKPNFKLRFLPVWDLIGVIPRLGFWLENVTFALQVVRTLGSQPADAIVYSRDQISLWAISSLSQRPIYFEFHVPPEKVQWWQRTLWKKTQKIFTINEASANFLIQNGVPTEKIAVSLSAVDPEFISALQTTDTFQREPGESIGHKYIVYTGHLYPEKGIETLLVAATLLPKDYWIIIVGGTEELVKKYRRKFEQKELQNVRFIGWVPHIKIPHYLQLADILIIPNSAKFSQSRDYTSPMKVAEYLVSGKPIVASDVPSLREALGDDALYFTADDPVRLAEAIQKASHLPLRPITREKVQTWKQRAEIISKQFI